MLTPRVLFLPSTPTLLIDERRGTFTDMLAAFAEQARRFEDDEAEAIAIVTSRWIGTGLFHADDSRRHTSLIDLPGFGVRLRADAHMTIAATFTVPVYQGLYGEQHKERYELLFGTAYDF